MASNRRQYSDHDKAEALAALAANGGNMAQTSRQLGIPFQTLRQWSINQGISHGVTELREEKREALQARLEDLAHRLIDAAPDKIEKANLQQVLTSLAITIDKMLLLAGTKIDDVPDTADTQKARAAQIASMLAGKFPSLATGPTSDTSLVDSSGDIPVCDRPEPASNTPGIL